MKKRIGLILIFISAIFPDYSRAQYQEEITTESIADRANSGKIKPEQNYLEMAINYINDKNYSSARRYLQLAQESGDEKVFQDSLIWNMYIDSLEGKKNMDTAIGNLPDEIAAKAMYYVSDGWQTYFEKNPEIKDIYYLSIEYKEKLIARYPDSEFAILAVQQLVPLFINEKNYDKALVYLLKYLDENKMNGLKGNDDTAWFYLGQILENSREYRDLHKAIKAYQMVMKNPDSLFFVQAQNRIEEIEKFYHIIQ